jgi:hypothetical protein
MSETKKLTEDEAMVLLYEHLKSGKSGNRFTSLDDEGRREYMRQKQQESRNRAREAVSEGNTPFNDRNVRIALSDAAIAILATDAPGSDQIRHALASVFKSRPGVPLTVSSCAKAGKLRPKLLLR